MAMRERAAEAGAAPDLTDAAAFERAVAEHRPAMVLAARSVLQDIAAAEDAVQDALMQLWLHPERYDASRGGLGSYLTMLARSRALDRWRSRAALESAVERARGQLILAPLAYESAAEPVLRRESAHEAMSALATLPGPQRDALVLTFGRGLTMSQLADHVDIPVGTAKSRVRIGLRKARRALAA
jgi:RNA polymerase sigma-70 factor (ECF subfamily)